MIEKRYVIRKYVMATSAMEAIKKEGKLPVDEVVVDEKWDFPPTGKVGFSKQTP